MIDFLEARPIVAVVGRVRVPLLKKTADDIQRLTDERLTFSVEAATVTGSMINVEIRRLLHG